MKPVNYVCLGFMVAVMATSACQQSRTEVPVSQTGGEANHANERRPNIILIYADDVDCESLFSNWPQQTTDTIRFPALKRLVEGGVRFSNFHVSTPVCGPSRACLLSGQYAHRNGVRVNEPGVRSANGFPGGYREFDTRTELGRWMKQAGYRTAYVGKYLHNNFFPMSERDETWNSIIPEGWDSFFCCLGGEYYGFRTLTREQDAPKLVEGRYRTDFESEQVCSRVKALAESNEDPFFLCWAPYAAHVAITRDRMSAERHKDRFTDIPPPTVEMLNRHNLMPNVPAEIESIPFYLPAAVGRWWAIHQRRLQALQALDDGVGQLLDTLQAIDQLENTIVIFTSDHGFSLGQHRHFGKRFPYDRITRVPCIAMGPGIPANQESRQLLGNIDIAPTLLDLAGGPPPREIDGVSFAPLLVNPQASLDRPGILLENWDRIWCNGVEVEAAYVSLRTTDHVYTEWASGSYEYFDVTRDPDQFENLYPNLDSKKKSELKRNLKQARARPESIAPVISRELLFPATYDEHDVISGNFLPVPFSGFVEDDDGIQSVEMQIYCEKIDSYWDGERWSTSPATMLAKLAIPGGHITKWNCILDTSAISFDPAERMNRRDVVINVIATDIEGNQSVWDNAWEFKLKITDPETWIDPLPVWDNLQKPLQVTGRAADNFKMDRVELLIVDLDNNRFWDDANGEWIENRIVFEVPVQEMTGAADSPGDWVSWRYDFHGSRHGKIFFCPRAYDAEGNFDDSLPFQILPFEQAQQ